MKLQRTGPREDVDRAKAFYVDQLGFVADVDVSPVDGVRVVQLTPPGSACSIGIGTGLAAYEGTPVRCEVCTWSSTTSTRPERVVDRGVDVGEVTDVGGGVLDAALTDPDGNTLTLQQMPWRTGDAF